MPERFVNPSDAPPVQRLVLPVPPSANRYWRHDRGVTHLSEEARTYRRDVAAVAQRTGATIVTGDVVLRMIWCRARRQGDLDNRLKQALDAMQGLLFVSDAAISEIRFCRCEDKNHPRLEVLIARAGTPEARQILTIDIGGRATTPRESRTAARAERRSEVA